jgi:hypothetical protein
VRWRDPVPPRGARPALRRSENLDPVLSDQDRALGVSPLASMPAAADRTPPHIRSLALVMAALESSWRGRRVRAEW